MSTTQQQFALLVRKIVLAATNCWCFCATCMGGGHCYNKGTNCLM